MSIIRTNDIVRTSGYTYYYVVGIDTKTIQVVRPNPFCFPIVHYVIDKADVVRVPFVTIRFTQYLKQQYQNRNKIWFFKYNKETVSMFNRKISIIKMLDKDKHGYILLLNTKSYIPYIDGFRVELIRILQKL